MQQHQQQQEKKQRHQEKKNWPTRNERMGWNSFDYLQGTEEKKIRKYQPDQIKIAEYMLQPRIKRFAALWGVGKGKTLVAVLVSQALLQQSFAVENQRRKTILVLAKSLEDRFRDELRNYGRSDAHIAKYYEFWTYQKAQIHWKTFSKACKNNIVIIDEFHFLRTHLSFFQTTTTAATTQQAGKNVKVKRGFEFHHRQVNEGVRSAVILKAARKAWKLLLMTATPMINSVSDVINMGYCLTSKPQAYFQQFMLSNKAYAQLDTTSNYPDELKMLLQKTFQNKIHCRLSTEKVLDQDQEQDQAFEVPSSSEINVLIEMDRKYAEAYEDIEQAAREKLQDEFKELTLTHIGNFYNGVRRAVNKIGSLPSQKLLFIRDITLRYKRKGKRGIITSNWLKHGISLVMDALGESFRIAVITGEEKLQARTDAVNRFNRGELDIIMLSSAGSTGIDLHGAAFHINVEGHWNEKTRLQANGRGVRVGSHKNSRLKHVQIYNLLLCKPGYDFHRACALMNHSIDQKWTGAPHEILKLEASVVTPETEFSAPLSIFDCIVNQNQQNPRETNKLVNLLMKGCSIDMYLWVLQFKKCKNIDIFTQFLQQCSL